MNSSCANSQIDNFMPSNAHQNSLVAQNVNLEPSNSSSTLDMFNSPFSPDESSYSENSDYTSDEYDSDGVEPNTSKYQQSSIMSSLPSSVSSTNTISSSSASLPPFPTISASGVNATSVASHSNTFIPSFTQNSQFSANLSAHPLVSASFTQPYVLNPQLYTYTDLYQRQYNLLSHTTPSSTVQNSLPLNNNNNNNNSSNAAQTNSITTSSNSVTEDEHEYTDLSLAIASSSAVESLNGLLSAATNSKDNRVTPVSLHADVLKNISESEQICKEGEPDSGSSLVATNCVANEGLQCIIQEAHQTSVKNDEVSENFGEIIKKTMVETVTA